MHAWEWFKYHADQRLRSFYYFLITVGALSVMYSQPSSNNSLRSILPILGAFICFVFYLLDIRNEELINNSKSILEKLQNPTVPIIENDSKYLPIFRHSFLIKFVYITIMIFFISQINNYSLIYHKVVSQWRLLFLYGFTFPFLLSSASRARVRSWFNNYFVKHLSKPF